MSTRVRPEKCRRDCLHVQQKGGACAAAISHDDLYGPKGIIQGTKCIDAVAVADRSGYRAAQRPYKSRVAVNSNTHTVELRRHLAIGEFWRTTPKYSAGLSVAWNQIRTLNFYPCVLGDVGTSI